MDTLTTSQEKCLALARDFIKQNAFKRSMRGPIEMYAGDQAIAGDVLIGNIAHDQYLTCVAKESKGSDSQAKTGAPLARH